MRRCVTLFLAFTLVFACTAKQPGPFRNGDQFTHELNLMGKKAEVVLTLKQEGDMFKIAPDFKGLKRRSETASPKPILMDRYGQREDGYASFPLPPAPLWIPPSVLSNQESVTIKLKEDTETYGFEKTDKINGREVAVYKNQTAGGQFRAWMDLETGYLLKAQVSTGAGSMSTQLKKTNVEKLKDVFK